MLEERIGEGRQALAPFFGKVAGALEGIAQLGLDGQDWPAVEACDIPIR